jgi:hypothetical protein
MQQSSSVDWFVNAVQCNAVNCWIAGHNATLSASQPSQDHTMLLTHVAQESPDIFIVLASVVAVNCWIAGHNTTLSVPHPSKDHNILLTHVASKDL